MTFYHVIQCKLLCKNFKTADPRGIFGIVYNTQYKK